MVNQKASAQITTTHVKNPSSAGTIQNLLSCHPNLYLILLVCTYNLTTETRSSAL
jgi:hypothetical protein